MTQSQVIIDYLREHPMSTARRVSDGCKISLKSAAAECSRLHRADEIRAESIWLTVKVGQARPVLHYFLAD